MLGARLGGACGARELDLEGAGDCLELGMFLLELWVLSHCYIPFWAVEPLVDIQRTLMGVF